MRIDTEELIIKYKDDLFRIAFHVCQNKEDSDDAVQETFIQYHVSVLEFQDEIHIKAWLIRVVINKAKDLRRSGLRRFYIPLEEYMETLAFETPETKNIFYEVMKLPERYRMVIHLFYYEEYTIHEIAQLLKLSESNVKVRLSRGRKLLKNIIQEVLS